MTIQQLIARIDELAFEGKDFDEIKAYVKQMTSDDANRQTALVHIDRALIDREVAKQERAKLIQQMLIGGFVVLLGTALAWYTYISSSRLFYATFGLILYGAWHLKESYKKYQLPLEDFAPRNTLFKKTRFRR
jgi:hypothetical protein